VTGSYLPSEVERELRDLTRHWTTLTDERGQVVKRIQKVLEAANFKLDSVASDITGVSVRQTLVIAYHLLRRYDTYHERGADYYDQRQREQVQRQAVRRLEPLGYQVTITNTKAA
jgi:acyl-CoA reductase-like NAD-dependent aldehyde dehydrogenase